MIFKGSYHDFVLKCEKWLKIPKKNPKNDQKCKNQQKKTIFSKKWFFHQEVSGTNFFIGDSDRYFIGEFLKNYKNFEI